MAGYVFIDNGNKPTSEQANSRSQVKFDNFCLPCLEAALEKGYNVYYGVNRNSPEELKSELPVSFYDSHTYRSITAFKDNYIAYKNCLKVIEKGCIDVIHCNTPIGGMIGRICGKKAHVGKIIYTAHGFHFFKGAPLFNNTILKFAEWIMAHWTDALITMNEEDYEAALKFKLRKGGKVFFVHGVGIDVGQYGISDVERAEKRSSLGIKPNDVAVVSAGDLVRRKDYATAIRAIALTNNKHIHYFICGKGPEMTNLIGLAEKLGVKDNIHFLGFRSDVREILGASDIFLFTTLQEGLPRSMMEAMASGLPCVVSRIRGNIDLMNEGEGGFLCETKNAEQFAASINKLVENEIMREEFGEINKSIIKQYDVSVVRREIKEIYDEVL